MSIHKLDAGAFNGKISDLHIWNRDLTEDELARTVRGEPVNTPCDYNLCQRKNNT